MCSVLWWRRGAWLRQRRATYCRLVLRDKGQLHSSRRLWRPDALLRRRLLLLMLPCTSAPLFLMLCERLRLACLLPRLVIIATDVILMDVVPVDLMHVPPLPRRAAHGMQPMLVRFGMLVGL